MCFYFLSQVGSAFVSKYRVSPKRNPHQESNHSWVYRTAKQAIWFREIYERRCVEFRGGHIVIEESNWSYDIQIWSCSATVNKLCKTWKSPNSVSFFFNTFIFTKEDILLVFYQTVTIFKLSYGYASSNVRRGRGHFLNT